jgi:hypothetical protein
MKKNNLSGQDQRTFEAILESDRPELDVAYVSVPFDVEQVYGTRGQVKVKATFDGHAYRGVLANMGLGCHQIGVRKDVRKAIGKGVGDKVFVTLERDLEERIVNVPEELQKLFAENLKAKAFYDSLSFTNRKEYALWISSAKRPETRKRRLKQILEKLSIGKKNPGDK